MRDRVSRFAKRLGLTSPLGIGVLAVAGVALAVAIVTLSVSVSSNEYQPAPPAEELSVALANGATNCSDPNYIGYSTTGVDLGALGFDLNDGSNQFFSQVLCVANFGSSAIGEILVSPVATANGEDSCSSSEGAADPEGANCGTAGELHPLLVFGFNNAGSNQQVQCASAEAGHLDTADVTPNLSGATTLDPGGVCVFQIYMRIDATATEAQKTAASTDSADFVIDVAGTAVGS